MAHCKKSSIGIL